jgi:hypothetical protein
MNLGAHLRGLQRRDPCNCIRCGNAPRVRVAESDVRSAGGVATAQFERYVASRIWETLAAVVVEVHVRAAQLSIRNVCDAGDTHGCVKAPGTISQHRRIIRDDYRTVQRYPWQHRRLLAQHTLQVAQALQVLC